VTLQFNTVRQDRLLETGQLYWLEILSCFHWNLGKDSCSYEQCHSDSIRTERLYSAQDQKRSRHL